MFNGIFASLCITKASSCTEPGQLAVACLEVVVIDRGDGCHVALGVKNAHMGQIHCLKGNLHKERHSMIKHALHLCLVQWQGCCSTWY